ncbi:MAG: trypsin-like peptidase domain-containing protein [Planctomycetes bacterium]|nr:trypsin-like peptidase domain-containing protein [Planctomycetota bacterium]
MRIIDVTARPVDRSQSRSTVLALLGAAALFAAVSWRIVSAAHADPRPETLSEHAPSGVPTPERLAELRDDELATIELFKRNSAAVVHITNTTRVRTIRRDPIDYPIGSGTGFVWDEAGHIVTNHHVVAQANGNTPSRYFVRFAGDEEEYEADVVATAPHRDIAVLKLLKSDRARVRPIALGRSADLAVGQKVFAIGNPFGLDQTLTTGIISGLGREIRSQSNHKISDVIQTDAAINPGNSGGPLLDSSGRLIGVNTAIVSPSGAYAGIGFAVPSDTVKRVVEELIEYGVARRPGLGVTLLDDVQAQRLGLRGVGVVEVGSSSAAAAAGLRAAGRTRGGEWLLDEIISIDGVEVRSQENLLDALDQKAVGDTVKLVVRREGRTAEVPVTLQWIE